ncbi:hypothetical protein A2U01_0097225, partial [Trifolium medium]|nr:hypothetical protein [Trifolium medium]
MCKTGRNIARLRGNVFARRTPRM